MTTITINRSGQLAVICLLYLAGGEVDAGDATALGYVVVVAGDATALG